MPSQEMESTEQYFIDKAYYTTQIATDILRDSRLSVAAKAVYGYLSTNKDTFIIYFKEVVKHFKEGEKVIRRAFNELIEYGLLNARKRRNEKGQIKSFEYNLIRPQQTKLTINTPLCRFGDMGGAQPFSGPVAILTHQPMQWESLPWQPLCQNRQVAKRQVGNAVLSSYQLKLSNQKKLSDQGELPLLGVVPVKKMTKREKQDEIAKRCIDYLNKTKPCTGRGYQYTEANLKRLRSILSDGNTEADIRAVIKAKAAEWPQGHVCHKFIQPATLFAKSHFDDYLEYAHMSGIHTDYEEAKNEPTIEEHRQREAELKAKYLGRI